jgi:hypothetical protein
MEGSNAAPTARNKPRSAAFHLGLDLQQYASEGWLSGSCHFHLVARAVARIMANFGNLYLRDGEVFRLAAVHNTPPLPPLECCFGTSPIHAEKSEHSLGQT